MLTSGVSLLTVTPVGGPEGAMKFLLKLVMIMTITATTLFTLRKLKKKTTVTWRIGSQINKCRPPDKIDNYKG